MTIPSNVTRNSYTGTGITGPYPVTFKFFEDADLKVTVADTNGVESVKTLTTDYTVTGAGEQAGGSITFTASVANGYSIVIEPKADLTQDTDIKNEGGNLRESIEDRFDRLCRDDQVQQNLIDRAVKLKITDVATTSAELPSPEAGRLLRWNDTGSGLVNASSSTDGSGDFEVIATGSTTARWISDRFGEVANVKDFGAVGDGATDDTLAIQAAIDSLTSGGCVVLPDGGSYLVSKTVGINDRWGVKITSDNITVLGLGGASLGRYDSDISTYAKAYPLLFIGTPDNNASAATKNVRIIGVRFVGDDTRHAISGGSPQDFRCAVVCKNTNGTVFDGCSFDDIDSSAVFYQYPAVYDYASSVYYNTTCNYNTQITNCSFVAQSHSTAGRALIHAIELSGVTNAVVSGNTFSWCDVAVNGDATFNDFSETDTSTWTPTYSGWSLGAVKRVGRNWSITGNALSDSSENSLYCSGVDCSISGNVVRITDASLSVGSGIKLRGRGITVSGNRIVNFSTGISVNEACVNVSVTGNSIYSSGLEAGGAIDINTDGLSSYIANRGWFATDYKPVSGIVVNGNSIEFPTSSASSSSHHAAFRIYTDSVDANYPNGQLVGVTISGNTSKNANVGVFVIGTLMRSVSVSGNTFAAKPFTRSGFSAGTTLNTRAVVQVNVSSSANALTSFSFSGNYVDGATYLFASTTGGGSATSIDIPFGIVGNTLNYVKNLRTADMKDVSGINRFTNNTAIFWLDRTFNPTMIQNSLYDGSVSASENKYIFLFDGTNLRFYTDDAGTFLTL